jgi:hypothetical protein
MNLLRTRPRLPWKLLALAGLLGLLAVGLGLVGRAADHRDGPIFVNTAANGRPDLNDIYVFNSPATPTNTVMAMTVSPFTGTLTPTVFDQRLFFDIKLDNNGDAIEDMTFRVTFSAPDDSGVQQVTLRGLPAAKFPNNGILAKGKTGQNLPIAGGGTFRAANHDDPFFFDAQGFTLLAKDPSHAIFPRPRPQDPQNPGPNDAKNFFANANTLAIIIEMPTTSLLSSPSNSKIGVWIRTELNGVQLDRMGRPAINTALIPPLPRTDLSRGDRRNAFNAGLPRNDIRDFRADMIAVLTSPNFVYKRTTADATALANFLLPDILTFDTSKPFDPNNNAFPNGRQPRDPVIHTELAILLNGALTTDNVDDDNGSIITDGTHGTVAAFPYLGPPNNPPGSPNP